MTPRRICLIHTTPLMVQLFAPPEALTAPVLSRPVLAVDYICERLARLRPH